MQTDRLVDEYLRQLDDAAAHLQRSRRKELVAEIRAHIDAALAQEQAAGEAAVRNVLERLGRPEEIVEAAEPDVAPLAPRRRGALEIAALVALIVPIVGWLVGIVLTLISRAWTNREKAIGIALALLPALLPALALLSSGGGGAVEYGVIESGGIGSGGEESLPRADPRPAGVTAESSGYGLGPVELTVLFLAGLPSAAYLGSRLGRRERA